MLQLGLADDHFKAIHVQLAMIRSMLRAYNASSQLINSIKRTFVESRSEHKEGYASRNGKFIPV